MKKKDSGFRNPYYYRFLLSENMLLTKYPKYVRNMLWFEGAGTKKQNNSPATTPEFGPMVIAVVIPVLSFSFVMFWIFTGDDVLGDAFFQIPGLFMEILVTYFGIVFLVFYASLFNRVRLRYGLFKAIIIENPGSPSTSTEFIGIESKLPDHVIEAGIQELKTTVHHLEHGKRSWLILNALIMAFGFYMIIEHFDILTGYFWIGAQIILFELIALPVIFFKKSNIDLLKENPHWPTYAEAIQYPVGREKEAPVEIDRYSRET